MALKGGRRITVRDTDFQWVFTHPPVRIMGDSPTHATVTVQGVDLHGKLQAEVISNQEPLDNYTAEHGGHRASLTPADTKRIIEHALDTGWNPHAKGTRQTKGPLLLSCYSVPE